MKKHSKIAAIRHMLRSFRESENYGFPRPDQPIPENWHATFIEHIASIIRPIVYVELGLYQCEVFNKVIPYTQRAIGVDMNPEAEKYMTRSDKSFFVHATTDEFAASLKHKHLEINMLFIDANHSKEAVQQDFWNFFPLIVTNGLILIHDAYPANSYLTSPGYCGNGYKTIAELSRQRDLFELITIPINPGLAICRKREKQLLWE